ncbi:hypothetical protein CPC08DRAFT_709719 [Agrocybe pediades]|nr:hypothetical protein CPC08DRAFT_709719 [Agrocybe pediades]
MLFFDCARHNENCIDPISPLGYIKSAGGCPFPPNTCEPCQKFPDLENEIRKTTQHLKELLSRHQALRTEANYRHPPIIRDLPVEILSRIFEAYLPDDISLQERLEPHQRISKIALPLKLGAVCHAWRKIAWSTPKLWTQPYITDRCNILEEWVHRSGSLPLDIFVSEAYITTDNVFEWDGGMKCMQLVARCADRWRDLDLMLGNSWVRYLFSEATKVTRVFGLRHFVFMPVYRGETGHSAVPDEGEILETWPLFTIKPHKLTMMGVWPGRPTHLDLSSITHLRGMFWNRENWLDILQQVPQLISCEFDSYKEGWYYHTTRPRSERHVLLEHLQHVSIHGSDDCSITMLDFFAAPSLREFSCHPDTRNALQTFTSFFARSRCSLTRLEINTDSFTPRTSFISLLDELPSLEDLTLNGDMSNYSNHNVHALDSFLQRLASTAQQTVQERQEAKPFLPFLESLTYKGDSKFPWARVPDFFGLPSDFGNPDRRPFKSLNVTLEDSRKPQKGIAQDVIVRLIELRHVGATINYTLSYDHKIKTVRWENYVSDN